MTDCLGIVLAGGLSLGAMLNLGEHEPPAYNFDGAHRAKLDDILAEEGLDMFTEDDRHAIAYTAVHQFKAWEDFPAVLPELQKQRIVVSFTILSYRIAIDTAKRNGFTWDAVLSCEGFGFYKLLPQAYLKAAELLQLQPEECCMVACHPFDLDAAMGFYLRAARLGLPLAGWGVATVFLNPDYAGRNAVEGHAWCYWALTLEPDADARLQYDDACGTLPETLSPQEVEAIATRTEELLSSN